MTVTVSTVVDLITLVNALSLAIKNTLPRIEPSFLMALSLSNKVNILSSNTQFLTIYASLQKAKITNVPSIKSFIHRIPILASIYTRSTMTTLALESPMNGGLAPQVN